MLPSHRTSTKLQTERLLRLQGSTGLSLHRFTPIPGHRYNVNWTTRNVATCIEYAPQGFLVFVCYPFLGIHARDDTSKSTFDRLWCQSSIHQLAIPFSKPSRDRDNNTNCQLQGRLSLQKFHLTELFRHHPRLPR